MTFEEFMQLEEEREKQRRIKRLAEELKPVTATAPKPSDADKKSEQQRLRQRIMDDAQKSYADGNKKKYELSQPPMGEVEWLVFDRATGELLGEAKAWRAYKAWESLNSPKSFPACLVVQRAEWVEHEKRFREGKRLNGAG
jgi:hypothetical protein